MNPPRNTAPSNADLNHLYEENTPRTGANRLPRDVFCDIFLRSLPGLDEMRDRGLDLDQASITTPLYISHVCQNWRRVALSLGELWSYFCITSRRRDSWKLTMDVFDTWLRRTNDCPLNFTVNLRGFHGRESSPYPAEHIISALISAQRRWRDVDLTFSRLSPEFPSICLSEMPMLTSLSLEYQYHGLSREMMKHVHVNVTRSPHLRRLQLHGVFDLEAGGKPSHPNSSGIPFSGLCLELLESTRNLERFIGTFCYRGLNNLSHSDETYDVVLHDLRRLSLDCRKSGRASSFVLDKLTLPTLEALSYEDNRRAGGHVLLNFVQRSMPPLTFLEIKGDRNEASFPVLHLLPPLKRLSLSFFSVSVEFFKAFNVHVESTTGQVCSDSGGEVLCPNLQALTLEEMDVMENDDDRDWVYDFTDMLKTRCSILRTFRKLVRFGNGRCIDGPIDIMCIDPDEDREELQYYVEYHSVIIQCGSAPFNSFYPISVQIKNTPQIFS